MAFEQPHAVATTALAEAAGAFEAAIDSHCELAVISKFGKEGAAGGGFCDAFVKATPHDVPVLISVAPLFDREWQAFTGGTSEPLLPALPDPFR